MTRVYSKDILKLRAAKAFTLIELLIVIAIIGILAAIAMQQFTIYRRNAFDSQMLTDLRNAVTAEEAYFVSTGQYTNAVADLKAGGFKGSVNVTLTITAKSGPPPGFTMTAVHSNCVAGSSRTINSTNYSIGGTGCQ